MARIRTIKPEFWGDEKLSLEAPTTRLVFLGLISLADDAGRLVDNLKALDGQLFPATDDSCRDGLAALAEVGRILRYRSESGQDLIQLVNWKRHQRVDKPNRHVLPAPPSERKRPTPQPEPPSIDSPPLANDSGAAPDDNASGSRRPRAPTDEDDRRPTTLDQRPTTRDQRPTTDEASSTVDVDRLLDGLPDDSTRMAWKAELSGAKVGRHGLTLTDEQIAQACRDYVGNGHLKAPSLRHFRAFLAHAGDPPAERRNGASTSASKQERGRQNLQSALDRRRQEGHAHGE